MKFILDSMVAHATIIGKNLGAQAYHHRRGIGLFSAGVGGGVVYGNVASVENHPDYSWWGNAISLSLAAIGIGVAFKRFPESRSLILLAGTGFETGAIASVHTNYKHAARKLEIKDDVNVLVDRRFDEMMKKYEAEARAAAQAKVEAEGNISALRP